MVLYNRTNFWSNWVKYFDDKNLIWADEIKTRQAIWVFRFRFKLLKVIEPQFWKNEKIKISDFNLNWQIGFQQLSKEHIEKLIERSKNLFAINGDFYTGASIIKPAAEEKKEYEEQTNIHDDLKRKIALIGMLQNFYTEEEYQISLQAERKNIDVVWKREIKGVPTYGFKIELSGNIEKAIQRLKIAHQLWTKILISEQVVQLFSKKKDLRDYEASLGIYDIY